MELHHHAWRGVRCGGGSLHPCRHAFVALPWALACALAAACGDGEHSSPVDPGGVEPAVAAVTILQGPLGLAAPGDTSTLEAVVLDQEGRPLPGSHVAWTSSAPQVVSVNSMGKVEARALGQASVSATADGSADTVDVEVDPRHSVARNCSPCHATLPGGHAALLLPVGSCWSCHTLQEGAHLPPQRRHTEASGGFALAGIHDVLACIGCHGAEGFAFTPAGPDDCLACHGSEYEDSHGNAGYPPSCGACHPTTEWGDAVFDHGEASGGFELRWAHEGSRCAACHLPVTFELRYEPAGEEDCYACHRVRYEVRHALDPYPTTCLLCHQPERWRGAGFPHLTPSGTFPLAGVHATLPCTACHAAVGFEPLRRPSSPGECVSCHRDDYDVAHGGSSFPTTCSLCHAPTAWSEGSVDHEGASGGFALVGAHTTLPCTACHAPGSYEPLYTATDEGECVVCHQDDYDVAHAGSGYPTACLSCHDGWTWPGAVFDHDAQYFPIFSGEHQNRWVSDGCATCHPTASDFSAFTCFACHRHSETRTDADHVRVPDYVYESRACLACHPDGTA